MMNPDILHLAERLVIAMETMSQDVKNMSAYVYDLSCNVSYLLNEKRRKECTSVPACDEGVHPPSVTSAAGQGASVEGEFSGQHEQADENSPLFVSNLEHGDSPFEDIVSISIEPHEYSDVLPSESHQIFTGGIKIEGLPEVEENDKSNDVDNMYGDSRNNVRDHPAHVTRRPEEQMSLAGGRQMESAIHTLMGHRRVPCEERSHKCSVCEMSFKTPSKLERHSRVHSGERPYKCNVCGKAFSQSSNVTPHMRSHTGERPYKCNICGKAFSQSGNLTLHMRSHTGETPYQCNVCGKAFRHSTTHNEHQRKHSRDHPN